MVRCEKSKEPPLTTEPCKTFFLLPCRSPST